MPSSSGPWKFDSWQKGVQITVVKNTKFKVGHADEDRQGRVQYILDTNARFQAMKASEGQVTEPQAAAPDRGLPEEQELLVDAEVGYSLRAHRHRVRPARVHPALKQRYRPPGTHHRDQPVADRQRAVQDDLPRACSRCRARCSSRSTRALQAELGSLEVQPGKRDRTSSRRTAAPAGLTSRAASNSDIFTLR